MAENIKEKDIWDIIKSIRFSTQMGKNAGRSDRVFYKHLQEGIETGDIDKVYEFILAYERGKGYNTDLDICKLFRKAFTENPNRLCKMLAERDSVIDYWVYVSSNCEVDMIVASTQMDVEYPLFYYECARTLLKNNSEELQCREGIISAVKKIAFMDKKLWKRWIRINEHNLCWQKILFSVLAEVDEQALEVFAENVHFEKVSQKNSLKVLSDAFEKLPFLSKEYVLTYAGRRIYERWNEWIDKKKNKLAFLGGILITDYTNLILHAMEKIYSDKEQWESAFFAQVEIMEDDKYRWYAKAVHRQSVLNYNLTQLEYLLLVGEKNCFVENNKKIADGVKLYNTYTIYQ